MGTPFAETTVRGVIRCPGCGAPAIWLAEAGGARAFVVRLPEVEAALLVREFSAVRTRRAPTYTFVERLTAALGARIARVWVHPDGRGHVRAEVEVEVTHGREAVRVSAFVGDAAVLAYRRKLPVMVPEALLVEHAGLPVPSCPNEDGGLPPAPREFMEFIDRVRAEDFDVP